MAVLLAGTAFRIDQHLEPNLAPKMPPTHLKGCIEQLKEVVVGSGQDAEGLVVCQGFVTQGFIGKYLIRMHGTSSGYVLARDGMLSGGAYTVSNGDATP